jgi:hypothetical protein
MKGASHLAKSYLEQIRVCKLIRKSTSFGLATEIGIKLPTNEKPAQPGIRALLQKFN